MNRLSREYQRQLKESLERRQQAKEVKDNARLKDRIITWKQDLLGNDCTVCHLEIQDY